MFVTLTLGDTADVDIVGAPVTEIGAVVREAGDAADVGVRLVAILVLRVSR